MARLKDLAGIEGLRRGKRRKTTKADAAASRHPDLVERTSVAAAPNSLWVSDLTYVATWSGFAYVYFITDAFSRMIVGWRVASHMKTDMVLDALEMARWRRDTTLEGLIATPTRARSSPQFAMARSWLILERCPQSEAWATPSTTRSPSRSTPPTRAS